MRGVASSTAKTIRERRWPFVGVVRGLGVKTIVKTIKPYLFLSPSMLLIAVFILLPLMRTVLLSFSSFDIMRPGRPETFVGFRNFFRVASSGYFLTILKNTVFYTTGVVAGSFLIGLSSALLLNVNFTGRSLVRTLIILAWAVPPVIACLIWRHIYDAQWGVLNYALVRLGIVGTKINWLMDPRIAMVAVLLPTLWRTFPFSTVVLLGALQTIPTDLYDAAKIDGGSALQLFRYIVWPHIRPISNIVILLYTIWTLKNFTIIYVMTEGGPGYATNILVIQTYLRAFRAFDFTGAAAIGVIGLAISLVISIVYLRYLYWSSEA